MTGNKNKTQLKNTCIYYLTLFTLISIMAVCVSFAIFPLLSVRYYLQAKSLIGMKDIQINSYLSGHPYYIYSSYGWSFLLRMIFKRGFWHWIIVLFKSTAICGLGIWGMIELGNAKKGL